MKSIRVPARWRRVMLTGGLLLLSQQASAALISWTDWTAATPGAAGTATGTIKLPDLSTIGVNYNGEVAAGNRTVIDNSFPSWLPASTFSDGTIVSNNPPRGDLVALRGGTQNVNTITFATPITDPVMAFWSIGAGSAPASFVFQNATPTFVAGGSSAEFSGNPITVAGNTVSGSEANGVVQFKGTFNSLSWTNPQQEDYYGFTLGVAGRAPVPEPGTYAIVAAGLGLLVVAMRRRVR
jgi:hypothetical protein